MDVSGGTVYRGISDKATSLTEPGLIVYCFDAPLVFANAAFFTERLEDLIANAGAGLNCIILDVEAISYFDLTVAEAQETLDADLERRGIQLWIARANGPLCVDCRDPICPAPWDKPGACIQHDTIGLGEMKPAGVKSPPSDGDTSPLVEGCT